MAGVASALLLSTPVPATAQQSELDTLRQQITALQQRLDALEAEQKKSAEAATKASAANTANIQSASKLPVTINGMAQIQGTANLSESGPTFPRQSDTFRLRRAELRITGRITPR